MLSKKQILVAFAILTIVWISINYVSLKNIYPAASLLTINKVEGDISDSEESLRFVYMHVGDDIEFVRHFVYTVQKFFNNSTIFVYGLNQESLAEVNLWVNAQLIRIEDSVLINTNLKEASEDLLKMAVLEHALSTFGPFIYIQNGYYPTGPFKASDAALWSRSFVGCDENVEILESPVLYLRKDSSLINDILSLSRKCSYSMCNKTHLDNLESLTKDALDQCISLEKLPLSKETPSSKPQITYKSGFFFQNGFRNLEEETQQNSSTLAVGMIIHNQNYIHHNANELSLYNIYIPSINKLEVRIPSMNFNVTTYIGYEVGTFGFSEKEVSNIQNVASKILKTSSITFVPLKKTFGNPILMWNLLYQKSIEDGFDYFYATSVTTRISTRNLFASLIYKLKGSSNIGVAYVQDNEDPSLFSPLVHRTHYAIFGSLYMYSSRINPTQWLIDVYTPYNSSHAFKEADQLTVYPESKMAYDMDDYYLETIAASRVSIENYLQ